MVGLLRYSTGGRVGKALVVACLFGLSIASNAGAATATVETVSAERAAGVAGAELAAPRQVTVGLAPVQVTNHRCHLFLPRGATLPPNPPPCEIRSAQAASPTTGFSLPYNGGPVVTTTMQQFIFLNCVTDNNHCNSDVGNPWGNGGFLNDLFNSPFIHITDQYTGQFTNGRYTTNTSSYAALTSSVNHAMLDSDVQNLIMSAINNTLNPNGGGGGYNQMYSFMLMPGQDLCITAGAAANCYCPDNNCGGGTFAFCAYHASFDAVDRTGTTIHVIYQAMPYQNVIPCAVNGPNGPLVDSTNNILAHEIIESITDPDGNAWVQLDGTEIADLCAFNLQDPITLNTRPYAIGKEWSNAFPNQTQANPSNQSPACVGYTPFVTAHDFNLDEASDIIWHDTAGDVVLWEMNGSTIMLNAGIATVPTNWSIVGQHDFYGNGRHSLVWRDSVTGMVNFWSMNGASIFDNFSFGAVPTNWIIAGMADFDGDGHADILWRDSISGSVVVWLTGCCPMGVKAQGGLGVVPSNWVIAGTGDFNGDGKADILWRDNNSGTVAIWSMNGVSVIGNSSVAVVPTNWVIVGVGDFNGDQTSDILWRDRNTGTVSLWQMNNGVPITSSSFGPVPSAWSIVDTGDYNYDGKSDILWRDTSGNVAMWFMNGIGSMTSAGVANVPLSWTIQGQNVDRLSAREVAPDPLPGAVFFRLDREKQA